MSFESNYEQFSKYSLSVFNYFVNNYQTACELNQDLWLHIFEHPELEIKHYRSYLFTACKRRSFNHKRRKTNKKVSNLPLLDSVLCDSDFEERVIAAEQLDKVLDLIALLPPNQRDACIARLVKMQSFKQIALESGKCYDTCKANYRHGILKIRDQVGSNRIFA